MGQSIKYMSILRGQHGDGTREKPPWEVCNMGQSQVRWGSPPQDSFLQPILGSHGLVIKKNGLPGPSVALNKSVVVGSRGSHASWGESGETLKSH